MRIIDCPAPLRRLAAQSSVPLYLVGGYVRNALLWGGTDGTDIDICGPLTVEELQQALQGVPDVRIVPVNPRVGTVQVHYAGQIYEYTTFRRDSYPFGGIHTPQAVDFVRTVEEDAFRRDFSVNALYADVLTGEVIDVTGGLADLEAQVLRTTRAPAAVFAEDGLRILRLVRFAAELGFTIEGETLAVAKVMRAQLADISPERKREELDRILLADTRYGVGNAWFCGLSILNDLALWPYLVGVDASLPLQKMADETLAESHAKSIAPIAKKPLSPDYSPEGNLRLAAICLRFAEAIGQAPDTFAASVLGNRGLRYANADVSDVCYRLHAATSIDDEIRPICDFAFLEERQKIWRVWVARHHLRLDEILPLLQNDYDADYAHVTWRYLKEVAVPLNHKDLPLTPLQIEALGVPKSALGKVMQRALEICAARALNPDEEGLREIIEEIKREMKWN